MEQSGTSRNGGRRRPTWEVDGSLQLENLWKETHIRKEVFTDQCPWGDSGLGHTSDSRAGSKG